MTGEILRTSGQFRKLPDHVEAAPKRGQILFRQPREEPTERAGAVTRALAFGLDGLIVNLAFSGLAAVAALIASAFTGNGNGVSGWVLALGSVAWVALGSLYLVTFWSLAGQTPGMRFFGIRLGGEGERLPARQSLKRLAGLVLAAIPLCLGFLGVLTDERRRGWQDRMAGVDVFYERNERTPAPWSTLAEDELAASTGRRWVSEPRSQVVGEPSGPSASL